MTTIPLTVTARNEERAIGLCLDSLIASKRLAEAHRSLRIDIEVVLDDCTDRTEEVVRSRGIPFVTSQGGKVEAQRRGLRPGPFQIFSDADILVSEDTLLALCEAMSADERLLVAFPPKTPLPPLRHTPFARALHLYNRRHGFSTQRTWFSGKLFAIRRWEVPTAEAIARRARGLRRSHFYDYASALRVDDIYLSRRAVMEGGPGALRETATGMVYFCAPETWVGMYRYYRRMRRELERVDALFPETRDIHRAFGNRAADLLRYATSEERAAWALFQATLRTCDAAYRLERTFVEHWRLSPVDPWPAIEETKVLR